MRHACSISTRAHTRRERERERERRHTDTDRQTHNQTQAFPHWFPQPNAFTPTSLRTCTNQALFLELLDHVLHARLVERLALLLELHVEAAVDGVELAAGNVADELPRKGDVGVARLQLHRAFVRPLLKLLVLVKQFLMLRSEPSRKVGEGGGRRDVL